MAENNLISTEHTVQISESGESCKANFNRALSMESSGFDKSTGEMILEDSENNFTDCQDNKKRSADELSVDESPKVKKKNWNELWKPDEITEVPLGLSKRQRKKYIRKVLWETKWRPIKRAKEKEKLKQKKLEARANNQVLGPSRKKLKESTMAQSNCKLQIVLDFSFDSLMTEQDMGKCLKQLDHCYCVNRRAANPLQLYVTNFKGPSREQMAKRTGYQNWDVHFHEENHLELFKKEECVYLTSDSDNILTVLDDKKVYIIGALVDHNKYKGKTLDLAKQQGIAHAQLPIGEFVQMNSRKVLTIDHVFQILLHVSEGISWKESFLRVIPQRKGAMEKHLSLITEIRNNIS